MNERDKELAVQAHVLPYIIGYKNDEYLKKLQTLADLIRADEREACAKHYLGIMRGGIALEREACAKVCDFADKSTHPADLADAIRARGNT